MPRINQLPNGSGLLSDDDLILFMNDPSGSASTRQVRLDLLRNGIFNQAAALQFRQGTDAERQVIVPASGEPIWTTDTKTFYIGDGSISGGLFMAPSPYKVSSTSITTLTGTNIITDSSLSLISCGINNSINNYSLSSIIGGDTNIILGDSDTQNPGGNSCIAGGLNNSIGQGTSYYNCFIGGGDSNGILDSNGAIIGGSQNVISSPYCGILGGSNNTVSSSNAASIGGYNNNISGPNSVVCGGDSNSTTTLNSIVLGGKSATTSKTGEVAHANGAFSVAGDAQHSILIVRRVTTDATANTVLTLDGASPAAGNRLFIPQKVIWNFTVKISAFNNTDSTGAGWTINGVLRRNASGTVAILGTNSSTSWSDSGMSTTSASVVADDTNKTLEIRVTGLTSKNIRWAAVVDITQVIGS